MLARKPHIITTHRQFGSGKDQLREIVDRLTELSEELKFDNGYGESEDGQPVPSRQDTQSYGDNSSLRVCAMLIEPNIQP